MKPLFLADVDDTCMTSARKLGGVSVDECAVGATLADGSAGSYVTPKHRALLDLMSTGDLVPVTARSRAVLARCTVPQAPAVCSNGGVIVGRDGETDQEWRAGLVTAIGDGEALRSLHRHVAAVAGQGFRHWIVEDDGLPLYVVVKSNSSDEDAVAALAVEVDDLILPEGWRLHVNGNNMALSPPWVSKRAAVRHLIAAVRRTTPDRLVVGVGDSASDLGFMAECDFAMHPTESQIGRLIAGAHRW